MSNDATKQMRVLVRQLRKAGYQVTQTNGGHYRVEAPDGAKVQLAVSPGSAGGLRNQKARLKKHLGYVA